MGKHSGLRVAAAVTAFAIVGPAAAANVVFTFDGPDLAAAPTYVETSGSHSVTVTGYRSLFGAAFTAAEVRRESNALGVKGGVLDGMPSQIDNAGDAVEAMLFDFGSDDYSDMSLAFTLLAANESMDIWWGDSLNLGTAASPLENHAANYAPPANPFNLASFSGSRYLIVAAVNNGPSNGGILCGPDNSCFRVDSITAAAIPEPASLSLVGLALAGLMASALRRRT